MAEVFPHYICNGFDFIEEMVENAQKNLSKLQKKNRGYANVEFKIGDLRKVQDFGFDWDVIFTVRALINLASLQEQLVAVSSMSGMLAPQGKLSFLENCVGSYDSQNHLREVYIGQGGYKYSSDVMNLSKIEFGNVDQEILGRRQEQCTRLTMSKSADSGG